MKKKLFLILVWTLAAGLFFLCFRSIDPAKAWSEITQARPAWLVLALIFNASIFIFWTGLWKLFLPSKYSVSFLRMFQANAFMSTACNTVPFPGGHALGVTLLARREKVGHAAALSVFALDQLIEGFAKIIILLLAAYLAALPEQMKLAILIFIFLVLVLALAMLFVAHRWPTDKAEEYSQSSFWGRVRSFISRWAHHLEEALKNFKTFGLGLILALGMKLVEVLAIWAVQKSLGFNLPFWTALLVMGALNLTLLLSVTPGNLGIYEGTVFLMYKFLGVAPAVALSLALLQHICFLVPMVGAGYSVLFFLNLTSFKARKLTDLVPEETR